MSERNETQIDVMLIASNFWKHKYSVCFLCFCGGILLLSFSYLVPVTYKSSISILPVEQNNDLNAGNMLGGGVGNIASLAGLDLNSQSSQVKINIEIIQSRQFILNFIHDYNLEADVIAADSWSRTDKRIMYDNDIYDSKSDSWMIEDKYSLEGASREPSPLELYREFSSRYSVSVDSDTGLLTLSMTHVSPLIAREWLHKIVEYANQTIREAALIESNTKVAYLEDKVSDTRIETIRNVFLQLIETELQSKMLIDTRTDYAYKVIDPAFLPEEKHSPKRVFYALFGAILTLLIVLVYLTFSLIFRGLKEQGVNNNNRKVNRIVD